MSPTHSEVRYIIRWRDEDGEDHMDELRNWPLDMPVPDRNEYIFCPDGSLGRVTRVVYGPFAREPFIHIDTLATDESMPQLPQEP